MADAPFSPQDFDDLTEIHRLLVANGDPRADKIATLLATNRPMSGPVPTVQLQQAQAQIAGQPSTPEGWIRQIEGASAAPEGFDWRGATGVLRGLGSVVTGPLSMAAAAIPTSTEDLMVPGGVFLRKAVAQPAIEAASKAKGAVQAGDIPRAAFHTAAAVVPFAGPMAEHAYEQAQAGDTAGAVGELGGGLLGGVGAGKLMEALPRPHVISETSDALAGRLMNSILQTKAGDLSYGKNPGRALASEGVTAMTKGNLLAKIKGLRQETGAEIGKVTTAAENRPTWTPEQTAATQKLENFRARAEGRSPSTMTPQPTPGAYRINLQRGVGDVLDPLIEQARDGGQRSVTTALENLKDDLLRTAVKYSNDGGLSTLRQSFDAKNAVAHATDFSPSLDMAEASANRARVGVYQKWRDAMEQDTPSLIPLNERYANFLTAEKRLEAVLKAQQGKRLTPSVAGMGLDMLIGTGSRTLLARYLADAGKVAGAAAPPTPIPTATYLGDRFVPDTFGGPAGRGMRPRLPAPTAPPSPIPMGPAPVEARFEQPLALPPAPEGAQPWRAGEPLRMHGTQHTLPTEQNVRELAAGAYRRKTVESPPHSLQGRGVPSSPQQLGQERLEGNVHRMLETQGEPPYGQIEVNDFRRVKPEAPLSLSAEYLLNPTSFSQLIDNIYRLAFSGTKRPPIPGLIGTGTPPPVPNAPPTSTPEVR